MGQLDQGLLSTSGRVALFGTGALAEPDGASADEQGNGNNKKNVVERHDERFASGFRLFRRRHLPSQSLSLTKTISHLSLAPFRQ